MCAKKRIALVTGGYSGEAVISYKSAVTIDNHLNRELFDVYKIDVNPQGWFYTAGDGTMTEVDRSDFTIDTGSEKISFDAVFMGMHGTPGEDGKLQGYFDMLNLPYTSCNAAASAITFNKRYTVAIAAMAGVNVAKSMHLFKEVEYDLDVILSSLVLPVFVKPNNGGSSIGISKVSDPQNLIEAIEKAFNEDNQVLIEEMISGREFTVGVYKTKGEIKVLPVTEVVTHNEFFDFNAKYEGASSEVTPAEIPEQWKEQLEAAAKKIYSIFNCRGVVRIDFIYSTKHNVPFMIEVNTVPGQSEASIVPQQVKAAEMDLTDFYTALVEEALMQ